MGVNQAGQRARRANAAGTNRKPVRIVNISKTPAKAPNESPAAPSQQNAPQRVAAEKVLSPATPAAGAMMAEEDEGSLTRREVVASLPELGSSLGMVPVRQEKYLLATPLRSNAIAGQCYFDEATSRENVDKKVKLCFMAMRDEILRRNVATDPSAVIPYGAGSFSALPSRLFRNKACGVIRIRVDANATEGLIEMAKGAFAVTVDGEHDGEKYEVTVPDQLYPGAVIEQIHDQFAVAAAHSRAFDYGEATSYRVAPVNEEMEKKLATTPLKIGADEYWFKPIDVRPSIETIYFYGHTGIESARKILKPNVATELGISADRVMLKPARGIRQAVAQVGSINFPYTDSTYLQVLKLLSIGEFKVYHPDGDESIDPLRITVAANLRELQEEVGIPFLSTLEENIEKKEAEVVEALDLSPLKIGALIARLIPTHVWEARRAAGGGVTAGGGEEEALPAMECSCPHAMGESLPSACNLDPFSPMLALSLRDANFDDAQFEAKAEEAPTVPELTECEGPGELGVGESMWVEMLLGRLSSSDAEPTIWLHVRSEEEDAMRAWGAAAARHRSCRGAGERRRMERLLGWGYSGNSLRDCL